MIIISDDIVLKSRKCVEIRLIKYINQIKNRSWPNCRYLDRCSFLFCILLLHSILGEARNDDLLHMVNIHSKMVLAGSLTFFSFCRHRKVWLKLRFHSTSDRIFYCVRYLFTTLSLKQRSNRNCEMMLHYPILICLSFSREQELHQ